MIEPDRRRVSDAELARLRAGLDAALRSTPSPVRHMVLAAPQLPAGWQAWRAGTCTGCGMDDKPVKGPPAAGLCTYCDELRILPPPPGPRPPAVRDRSRRARLATLACLIGVAIVAGNVRPLAWMASPLTLAATVLWLRLAWDSLR